MNCTEGFAIPLDIKGLIGSKFQSVEPEPTAEEDSNREMPITEDGYDSNLEPNPKAQQDADICNKGTAEAANNKYCLKGKSESTEPRGPLLIDLAKHKIISHALGDGHDNDVIAQVGSTSHKVTRGAMQSLKSGQWIKDEVINSFFHLLSCREEELSKNNVTQEMGSSALSS
jgi:hypothetical protein